MNAGAIKVLAVFVVVCGVIFGAMQFGGSEGGFGTPSFWVACGLIFAMPLVFFLTIFTSKK